MKLEKSFCSSSSLRSLCIKNVFTSKEKTMTAYEDRECPDVITVYVYGVPHWMYGLPKEKAPWQFRAARESRPSEIIRVHPKDGKWIDIERWMAHVSAKVFPVIFKEEEGWMTSVVDEQTFKELSDAAQRVKSHNDTVAIERDKLLKVDDTQESSVVSTNQFHVDPFGNMVSVCVGQGNSPENNEHPPRRLAIWKELPDGTHLDEYADMAFVALDSDAYTAMQKPGEVEVQETTSSE